MSTPTIIDDTDPRITYTPISGWYVGGVSNELDGTAHGTDTAGATASFTFSGLEAQRVLYVHRVLIWRCSIGPSTIAVYGTIDITTDTNHPYDPVSMYIIDGGPPTYYKGVRSSQIIQYRVLYFQSPHLSAGQHTLLVNSTVTRGYFNIDYLLLQASPTATSPSSSTSTSTSNSSPTTSSLTIIPSLINTTSTSSPSPGASSSSLVPLSQHSTDPSNTITTFLSASTGTQSSHSTSVSTGAIAGGVVGGVVVLLLLSFLAFYFCKPRNRGPAGGHPTTTVPNSSPEVTPFSQWQPIISSGPPSMKGYSHNPTGASSSVQSSEGQYSDPFSRQGVSTGPAFESRQYDYAGAPPSYHVGSPL